jgi:hypothetical protein
MLEFITKAEGLFKGEYDKIFFFCTITFMFGIFPFILASIIGYYPASSFIDANFIPERTFFYLIASTVIGVFLFLELRFLKYLDATLDFFTLLKVKNPYEGVNFWRNFVRCRFVGVQDANKIASFSQVDIFASGLSIIILCGMWFANRPSIAHFLILIVISVFL